MAGVFFFFLRFVGRCELDGLSAEEEVKTHTEAVSQDDHIVSAPTAAAVDLCVECRMRYAEIFSRLSARELVNKQQVIDALGNQLITAEAWFFVVHVDPSTLADMNGDARNSISLVCFKYIVSKSIHV